MNYTLILYKSDGYNTCMSCVMEQWGSEFSIENDITEETAIKRIAEFFTAPSEGGSSDAYIIGSRDGILITHKFEQYYDWRHDLAGGHSTNSALMDYEIDEVEGQRLNGLIRTKVSEILEQQRLESERAEAEEKRKKEKEKETYERYQLDALKQKYEGTK